MESYFMFKNLAIIIVAAKVCGIAARKCKAPQVVGGDPRRAVDRSERFRLGGTIRFSGSARRGRRGAADVLCGT